MVHNQTFYKKNTENWIMKFSFFQSWTIKLHYFNRPDYIGSGVTIQIA